MPKLRIIKRFSAFCLVAVMIISCFSFFTYDASAVSPTYYVSNEYKSSQYYKNLKSYTLTGDERYDTISIAMTQYGYHEGNSDADMGGGNREGYRNFVEYNRMYGKLDNGEGNGLSYGYSWCAAFVSWCLRQARVPTSTIGNFVSCSSAVKSFRSKGIFKEKSSGYVPIPGDIIFFVKPEEKAQGWISSHVGIVVGTDSEYVYTIEGNTDLFKVCQKKYPLDGEKIVGYAVPAYKTVDGTVYDFPLRDDGKHPGMFEVNKEELDVYSRSQGEGEVIGTIGAGQRIKVLLTDLGWGMIEYNGMAGWILLEYVDSRDYEIRLESPGAEPSSSIALKQRGEFITLAGFVPQKEGYTLAGWAKEEGGEIAFKPDALYAYEEDAVLYAVWKTSEYTVSFVDWDDSLISSAVYTHGSAVTVPNAPSRAADSEFTYEFAGWDAEVTPALGDVLYRALYTETPIPVTTPEETTEQAPVTTEETTAEETTAEETTEEITEEITEDITVESTELVPETEATVPVPEETGSDTIYVEAGKGCFSFVSFSVLAVVLGAIALIARKGKR